MNQYWQYDQCFCCLHVLSLHLVSEWAFWAFPHTHIMSGWQCRGKSWICQSPRPFSFLYSPGSSVLVFSSSSGMFDSTADRVVCVYFGSQAYRHTGTLRRSHRGPPIIQDILNESHLWMLLGSYVGSHLLSIQKSWGTDWKTAMGEITSFGAS